MQKRLVLASRSPRRQELLNQVGISFSVRKANIDESEITAHHPIEKVKQLAVLKGKSVPFKHNEVILSADTVVAHKQKIFEKPINKVDAYQMISQLSGDVHDVFTGVMIRSVNDEIVFAERTKVEFWPLSVKEIEKYAATNEPYDKAGAYGIQSLGAIFVKRIIGDYYNVVGLPISRVVKELRKFGVDLQW